jgi:hypothetical protein
MLYKVTLKYFKNKAFTSQIKVLLNTLFIILFEYIIIESFAKLNTSSICDKANNC